MDKSIILLWSVAILCLFNLIIAAFFNKKYHYSIFSPATLACIFILFLFFYHPHSSPMGMIYLLVFAAVYILIGILGHKKSESETLEKPILNHKIRVYLVIWLITSLISIFLIVKSMM
jgi:Ca2+/Na+ antiporter